MCWGIHMWFFGARGTSWVALAASPSCHTHTLKEGKGGPTHTMWQTTPQKGCPPTTTCHVCSA